MCVLLNWCEHPTYTLNRSRWLQGLLQHAVINDRKQEKTTTWQWAHMCPFRTRDLGAWKGRLPPMEGSPCARPGPEIHVKHWLNTGPALKCLIYIAGASAASGKSVALPHGDSGVAVSVWVCVSQTALRWEGVGDEGGSWGYETMWNTLWTVSRWIWVNLEVQCSPIPINLWI